jgi:hypothetical protein
MELDDFSPFVHGEAKQSHVDIAQEAAISRLCIVQDAYDFWGMSMQSSGTGSGAPAPG